jgi:hypothetical protein
LFRRLKENAEHAHYFVAFSQVVVNAKVVNPEPILASEWLSHGFDSASADELGLITQVKFDPVQHISLIECAHGTQVGNGFRRITDLVGFGRHKSLDALTTILNYVR